MTSFMIMEGWRWTSAAVPLFDEKTAGPAASPKIKAGDLVQPDVAGLYGLDMPVRIQVAVAVQAEYIRYLAGKPGINLLELAQTVDLARQGNNGILSLFAAQFGQDFHGRCQAVF